MDIGYWDFGYYLDFGAWNLVIVTIVNNCMYKAGIDIYQTKSKDRIESLPSHKGIVSPLVLNGGRRGGTIIMTGEDDRLSR